MKDNKPAKRISIPVPPKGPEQVIPSPMPQQEIQKSEPADPVESAKQVDEVVPPPKVDYATDLFGMLSMDGPSDNGSIATSADDDMWPGFQFEETRPTKPEDSKTKPTVGIENLFKDSPAFIPMSSPDEPQKDVKNDITSLFDKANMVSPFSVHQQQLAMLAQQQSLIMAAAAKSGGAMPQAANNGHQGTNATTLQPQTLPNTGYEFPGMAIPASGKSELEKFMQMGNIGLMTYASNSVTFPMPSIYSTGQNASVNGASPL